MKTIAFITITHRLYAHSYDNMPQGYERAREAMWKVSDEIVNALREKYGKTTLAPKITTFSRGDHDDDVFDYITLNVPKCELDFVKRNIHNRVADGGTGWLVSEDCGVANEREVEYSSITRKLRHGQMLAIANPGITDVVIQGVEKWEYDYGLIKATRRNEEDRYDYRKFFRYNRTGLSTKLLCSLDPSLTSKDFKTKIPQSARKRTDEWATHYITVSINDNNRASLMRIARTRPSVLKFGTVAVPDAEKSDFIKTIYAEMDKKKAAANTK
jgi:hypothetical protein